MANYVVPEEKLIAIANSIRSKTSKSNLMGIDDMPTEIESISGGGEQGIKLTQFDSLKFSAISSIVLAQGLNSDYSYYVEFSYVQGEDNVTNESQSMFGLDNTGSYRNFLSIGMRAYRYTFGGSSEYTVGWDQIWGRHHIFFNPADSKVYFDDIDTNQTYSKATYDFNTYPLKVGNINNEIFPGRIHRITIKNGDDVVADYVPAGYVVSNEVVISGLLDLVTNKLFCQPLIKAYN